MTGVVQTSQEDSTSGVPASQKQTSNSAWILDQTSYGWESSRGPIETTSGDDEFEFVGTATASQTLGATGAAGDYLKRLVITVLATASSSCALDTGAGTNRKIMPNGVNLGIYTVDIGAVSVSGAWKVSTDGGVSILAIGDFT